MKESNMDIKALKVEPSDFIVAEFAPNLSKIEVNCINDQLHRTFPNNTIVLMKENTLKISTKPKKEFIEEVEKLLKQWKQLP